MIVRPVRAEDLDGVMALADRSGFGLTNLPRDRDIIEQRIGESISSLSSSPKNGAQGSFLFVMEDPESGKIVGTGGITQRVGIGEPFYAYRIETHLHASASLGVRKEVSCLHLLKIKNGPAEIGSLFVHPDYQKHGHGRLMSLSRFLFIADHPDRFPSDVLAEMRGVSDAKGHSPFWESVGRHFFDIDFPMADYLTVRDKRFIAELMPTHPIYIPLLPRSAQSAVGQVHEMTKPALTLLRQEGFEDSGMVDIFDGGPIIRCPKEAIRTVKESDRRTFLGTGDPAPDSRPLLVARGRRDAFRVCITPGALFEKGGVRLSSSTTEALALTPGETVRLVPLRPDKRETK